MTPHKRRPPLRLTACLLAAAAIPLLSHAPRAFATDWVGIGDWNTAADWNPGIVPNSSFAIVNFNDIGVGAVNISSSVTIQSLNFNNLAGNYSLTSTTNQTLTVQNITVAQGVTGTETFNLAPFSNGNLLFPTASPLTITNNSILASLVIGPSITIGTPGGGGVSFNGPGSITLAGSFVVGGNDVVGGFTKNGPGLLDYLGAGFGLNGAITLNGGTLNFDYSSSTASKVSSSSGLFLKGGDFNLNANASAAVTQTIPTGLFVTSGHTDITTSGTGGAITLAFTGTSARTAGATLDVSSGLTLNAPGLTLSGAIFSNGFATFNSGATWATSLNASTISGLAAASYGTNVFNSLSSNTDVTLSAAPAANFSVNSLRFNTGNLALTLSGANNVINSGAILATPSAGNATITGGTIVSTTGELVVQVYDAAGMTIASAIQATSLTKAGPSALALSGNNTALTGAININRGSLIVNNINSINNASKINFNDLRTGNSLQTFTVDLGNNATAAVTQPILISAFGANPSNSPGTSFSTGNSANSLITLSGVISSAAGQTTALQFTGTSNTSGFNLTNANTFTGNVTLFHGFLGINSDASLGDPSNTLILNVGGTILTGGLVFLGTGINIQHPVNILLYTSVISNGNDSNTISGLISGTSNLTKDGTGTLTLANPANTITGGLLIAAGNLAVSADGNLGAKSGSILLEGGALETTASFTLSAQRIVEIDFGNTGTFNTDALSTLTVPQVISSFETGTLNKIGGGTLILSSSGTYALSLTVSAGTLVLNAAAFTGSTFLNNGFIIGQAGFTGSAFTNNGQITVTTGPWNISGLTNTNNGNIYLAPALGLQLGGGILTNAGAITLAGATISGSATLSNAAGGIISGPGLIAVPLLNSAGATLTNSGPGALIIQSALSNSGLIELGALNASLNGAAVANSGTIQGLGLVNNSVTNSGTIEAIGGTLSFSGQVASTGTIRAAAGNKVLMLAANSFPTNAGTISLAGGTFDNGAQTLNNTGQITGFGVLATGGLTNNGILTFTGGTSTINGNVTNNPGQTINILYQPALFTGNINNLGTINVTGTTITYTGTYTGNQYISDPSTNIFQNNVTIIPGGSMTGSPGNVFNFTGGTVVNNGTFNNAGALNSAVNVLNTGSFAQSGPQTWSPATTFTNTAGIANFQTDAGSPTASNLSIIINGGAVLFTGTQHLNSINLNAGTLGGYATIIAPLTLGSSPHTIAPSATLAPTSAGTLTLSALTTNSNTTLAFNLITPDHASTPSTNDRITLPTANTLTINGGKIQIANTTTGAPSLGYYQAIKYNGSIQGTGLSSLTLPAIANNIVYTFDTLHDPGFIDLHKGFLGDANDDGIVNAIDLGILATNFNSTTATWSQGDYNHDGIVNAIDLGILATNFNATIGAASFQSDLATYPTLQSAFTSPLPTPEPASLALLTLAALPLLIRKKRP